MQFQTADGSFQLKTDSGYLRLASLESIYKRSGFWFFFPVQVWIKEQRVKLVEREEQPGEEDQELWYLMKSGLQ